MKPQLFTLMPLQDQLSDLTKAKFIARSFAKSLKYIAASLKPLKKKNWCQIPDDYTQYLLGSTDSHLHTGSPHDIKEVFLLQENHQPELIVLGCLTNTTIVQITTYDLFSHRTVYTLNWAPTTAPHPTCVTTPPSKTNQALLTVGSLLAFLTFCLFLIIITVKTFKPRRAYPVTLAGPAVMVYQVKPLPRRAALAPAPLPYKWNTTNFAYPILCNTSTL